MRTVIYFLLLIAIGASVILIPKRRETRRVGVILLSIAFLCEVLVFNFHSYHLLLGGYERAEVDLESSNTLIKQNGEDRLRVELIDVGRPVGTLRIDCDFIGSAEDAVETPYVTVTVDACDETQQAYYRSAIAEGQIVKGDNGSRYLVLDLSGKVSHLRLQLNAKPDCSFALKGITLNDPIPMRFSPLRLLLTFGAAFAIYLLLKAPAMLAAYGERRRLFRALALGVTVCLILGAVALTFLYQYDRTKGISGGFAQTSGNQITQELVDAFEAGQVSLLDRPSEELLALDNPYDWSLRSREGVAYKWDHLLFEGKYYSYYGIAPVVLLFLPYHLLTGYYFPTPEAVLLFGAIGILFLTLTYLVFCDLFAKKLPINMLLAGLLICQLSSGVWYNFCSPLFYEIAQASGFCFTCMGMYFLLRSRVIGSDEPVRLPSLCLSAVCLSLAVLCRPTLALYCVAALVFVGFGLFKYRKHTVNLFPEERKKTLLATVRYLCAALLPYAIIGGAQMLYNHARFGSVMDFGIQYSLTINDFTRAQYHTDFVMIGLHNFLFAFPTVRPEFPYVFSNFSDLSVNGYYFIANYNAVGLFLRALPSLGYVGAVSAWRALSREERRLALGVLIPTCVLVPLGIIFSIWESGYGVRYCTDFAWQFILGGLSVIFLLYVRRFDGQMKTLAQRFLVLSLVVAAVCNFGMIYAYMSKTGYLEAQFLAFERLFDFWK